MSEKELVQDLVPTDRELELLDCIVGMMVQASAIEADGLINDQALSAYESAEAILAEYGLLIEVRWQDCGLLTRKDKQGRYPGTYFNEEKFRKIAERMRDI